MQELIIYSYNDFYLNVLHYIFENYRDQFKSFEYIQACTVKPYEYIHRCEKNSVKVCSPSDIKTTIIYKDSCLDFELTTLIKSNRDVEKIMQAVPGTNGSSAEIILKKIVLKHEDKDYLLKFVDSAKAYCDDQIKISRKSTNTTIKINMWRKDFWNLLFKSPKRPMETLYLKEGQKEDIFGKVEDFYSPETRDEYLSYGIPYKNVFMFYGVPGSGKTSTINAIASHFDADLYVIPISKELTDYGLIDAISYIDTETPENKKRMIVIEDIDSIFTDRKKGDDDNGITLQGLLNCFDGFSCVEGTLLFITANKPEVIDSAMLRSCRVDYKYELGYADEYQTKCIFERIAPKENKDNFSKFYKLIKNKEYTTAMLQEFLFFNRKSPDIMCKMDEFYEIIEKNKPGHFEKKKDNLYM